MNLNPVDYSVIEASLIKGDSIPAPSHLANIRVHLNEIFAKVIIALCEGGSNSPTLFPGDEMFESELEESFIFVTHSTVRFHPIKFIPSMEDLPELQIYTYIHTLVEFAKPYIQYKLSILRIRTDFCLIKFYFIRR